MRTTHVPDRSVTLASAGFDVQKGESGETEPPSSEYAASMA
jgi:hypothetical protein